MRKRTEQAAEMPAERSEDDLRPEYDSATLRELLREGVRGKYAERYRQGINLVKLAPDVAAAFPTEQAVNEALRKLAASSNIKV